MGNHYSTFVIRLKQNGKIRSRHYNAKTAEQAAMRVRGMGRILSVRKVHAYNIIGDIKGMNLEGIIGIPLKSIPEGGKNVVFDNTTVDSIVFSATGKERKKNNKKPKRRFNDESRE